jgi:hypothetical protein
MPHIAQSGERELEFSEVVGLVSTLVIGSGRKGEEIQTPRTTTIPRQTAIHRKGCLLLAVLVQPCAR